VCSSLPSSRQLSEMEVSGLLRRAGFPRDEADEWGSVFHHCYGVLCTPIPQYALSHERDEILRSLKQPYQRPSSRGVRGRTSCQANAIVDPLPKVKLTPLVF